MQKLSVLIPLALLPPTQTHTHTHAAFTAADLCVWKYISIIFILESIFFFVLEKWISIGFPNIQDDTDIGVLLTPEYP